MAKIARFALPLALFSGSIGLAAADQPGPDWMSAQQVIQQLKAFGYANITELNADDGYWEGEGTKNGRKMEFQADPRTGEILMEKRD